MDSKQGHANIGVGNTTYIYGWVSQPDGRGTIDIIWSSCFAVFLCTYTALCLNLPDPNESYWHVLLRRVRWMGIAIAGPEFVLAVAAGQYASASRAVQAFKEVNREGAAWTLTHAFFADMGGFVLQPRDSTPFPVNNKHILYLVNNKHLDMPNIRQKEIHDKSKSDTLVKSIIIIQISWLVLNVTGRCVQHLPITTLELCAVAIVVCTLATFFCWFHKPQDVVCPIVLQCRHSSAEILVKAGDLAAIQYRTTPLDFVDNMCPSWNANCMAYMNMRMGPHSRPAPRFTNDRFPDLNGAKKAGFFVVTLFAASLHVAGWNYSFPTNIERIFWRVTTLFEAGTMFSFWCFETLVVWKRKGRWKLIYRHVCHPQSLQLTDLARIRSVYSGPQVTPETFPHRWECIGNGVMLVFYLSARLYLVIEVFLSLRSNPASTYLTVDWVGLIPHV